MNRPVLRQNSRDISTADIVVIKEIILRVILRTVGNGTEDCEGKIWTTIGSCNDEVTD